MSGQPGEKGPGANGTASTRDEGGDATLDSRVIATFRHADPSGSSDFVLMLIDQFIQDAGARLATLRDAVPRQDRDLVRTVAHSLKGGSLTIGATRLGKLCGQLEDAANGPSVDAVRPSLMPAIDQEFARVCDALENERQRAKQPASPPSAATPPHAGTGRT